MGFSVERISVRDQLVADANPFPVTVAGGVTPGIAVKVSPAVTAGLYAANDVVGGKQTLTSAVRASGGTSRLENLIINDRGNQKAAGYVLIFDSDPTAATLTNDAAMTLSTDDLKVVARIDVSAADYVTLGSDSKAVADIPYAGRLLKASGSANLFAVFVTTGTPTYASTSDLQFTYNFSYVS
jgi:hypothetical protein